MVIVKMSNCEVCGKFVTRLIKLSKKSKKSVCKACHNKRWSKENIEKRRKIMATWRKKNPNYFRDYMREKRAEEKKEKIKKEYERLFGEEINDYR